MKTDLLLHSDLLSHELVSRWRYGARQREMLSVLNDIFDQFVPLSQDDGGLDAADVGRSTDTAALHAESLSSRVTTSRRGPSGVSFAVRD